MTKIPPVSLINSQIVPYSCEFIDGSLASCLLKPVNFALEVRSKEDLILDFFIHFTTNYCAGVRLTDGTFYFGDRPGDPLGWQKKENDEGPYKLIYSRQMQGMLVNGEIKSQVVGYTLGCQGKIKATAVKLSPVGDIISWVTY